MVDSIYLWRTARLIRYIFIYFLSMDSSPIEDFLAFLREDVAHPTPPGVVSLGEVTLPPSRTPYVPEGSAGAAAEPFGTNGDGGTFRVVVRALLGGPGAPPDAVLPPPILGHLRVRLLCA